MHEPTSSPLIHCLRISVLSSLLFIAGCSAVVRNQDRCGLGDLTPVEENALYRDLWSRHPDHQNLAMPYRGIIKSTTGTKPIWVVWMTESSPVGEGIIGTYDADHKLRDMRITRPVKNIVSAVLNKEIDILLVREVSATGTGLYEETMSIIDVGNLNVLLWSGKVESWVEGLEGRNKGHLIHRVVILLDLDGDEREELFVIKLKQTDVELQRRPYAKWDIECSVFSFNTENHKFHIQKEMTPHILHPPLEEEDNF